MPLNRSTIRALAASVALVAAGGTVAAAAVFHLPVLGFGPASAGATSNGARTTVTTDAKTENAAPIRVVRTRFVDRIAHRGSRTFSTSADAPAEPIPPAVSAAAPAAPTPVGEAPDSHAAGGDDGHESADDHDRVEQDRGDHSEGDNAGTADTGQSADRAELSQ